MMTRPQLFSSLLAQVDGVRVGGTQDPWLEKVTSDSRQSSAQTLFVAIRGEQRDGHEYVRTAIQSGASAILVERGRSEADWTSRVAVGEVEDTRRALGLLAASLAGPLPTPLADQIVGITGTNGKTTTCYILESIFLQAGGLPGVLGTVSYRVGDTVLPAPLTTPSPELLWQTLQRFVQKGATHVVMEVSSHALAQFRVDGLPYRVAGFTNLTQDHLDFHKTWDDYLQAKARLFWELLREDGRAILPLDDPAGQQIRTRCSRPVWMYSIDPEHRGDIAVVKKHIGLDGIRAELATPAGSFAIESSLLGAFNLKNLVLACGIALALDTPIDAIQRGIQQLGQVPGRMDRIQSPEGFQVVVDYAHTPDALVNIISSLRPLCRGRLIVVFGCGGDRDNSKRKPMGEVAAQGADLCVVTSDNPRTEDPEDIVQQVVEGVVLYQSKIPASQVSRDKDSGYAVEIDRRKAIQLAITWAKPDDIVLIAGKGHEDYQIVGHTKYPFDDRRIAQQCIEERTR